MSEVDDNYYCNSSRNSYLTNVYEDVHYNLGLDGDNIWSNIYQRKAFLTSKMGLKTNLSRGKYMIDYDSKKMYVNVPNINEYNKAMLIYETSLVPSGDYLRYDINPLNEENLSFEKFFMYLSLDPDGIYYNNLR